MHWLKRIIHRLRNLCEFSDQDCIEQAVVVMTVKLEKRPRTRRLCNRHFQAQARVCMQYRMEWDWATVGGTNPSATGSV